jgi:hypothetical protein
MISDALASAIERANSQELGRMIAILHELAAAKIAPAEALDAANDEMVRRHRAAIRNMRRLRLQRTPEVPF